MNKLQQLFPQFEPNLIDELSAEGAIREAKAGEVIMRTGQYMKSTMLVLDGIIKVFRENEEGGEFLMYYIKPGEACALSIICAAKMEASEITAVAMEDSILLSIPLQYMDEWMSKYKTWYYFVLETYRNRFEEMLTLVDQVAFRNMDERLEFYLKRHAEVNQVRIVQLSHQQIADELNSSREVISRLLKKMEQRGMLKLHRNFIELLTIR